MVLAIFLKIQLWNFTTHLKHSLKYYQDLQLFIVRLKRKIMLSIKMDLQLNGYGLGYFLIVANGIDKRSSN